MTQKNDAFIRLILAIEEEIAIRREEHVGYQPLPVSQYTGRKEQGTLPYQHVPFDSLPISEYTGLPYDPELITYLGPIHARPKRKFHFFRWREKPRPKQDHISLFEVLADGPYVSCEMCNIWHEWKREGKNEQTTQNEQQAQDTIW